ncbi:MAG: adenylate/guanylate cyclase domain-containing protein [Hyphomicrobiales bacterium]|nr:adenylate/guanylate cyclase domain-containing protein [Hyphomicrobiales bacterium]
MTRWLTDIKFSVLIGLIAALFAASPIGNRFEETIGLASLFRLRGPIQPPDKVAVVALDLQSAEHMDLPYQPRDWPRSVHAQLIKRLVNAGAAAIIFDVIFDKAQSVDEDSSLAAAISGSERVILVQGFERTQHSAAEEDIDQPYSWVWLERIRNPLPLFSEGALALAPFPLPKVPTEVHQFWTFLNDASSTPTLPAVALHAISTPVEPLWIKLLDSTGFLIVGNTPTRAQELIRREDLTETARAFRLAFKADPELANKLRTSLHGPEFNGADVSPQQRVLLEALIGLYEGPESRYLNFYGPPGTIQTIPYYTLSTDGGGHSTADHTDTTRPDLTGKVVFVGYSELRLPTKADGFTTVFSRSDGVDLSGVEIGATAFANLVEGQSLIVLTPAQTFLVICLFSLMIASLVRSRSTIIGFGAAVTAGLIYVLLALFLFTSEALWLPIATPIILQLPLTLFVGIYGQYVIAKHQRARMKSVLTYYVPEQVVSTLSDHQVSPITLKQTVYATCLATDAENFTALSEQLSPEQTASFLNEYFSELTKPLQQRKADFREFHADGVMTAWISQDHSYQIRTLACQAGLEILDAIDDFNDRKAPLRLGVRVGLHAGKIFVGHVGAGGRFAFRLVGDIVNTASRIESLNKVFGTRLLASTEVVSGISGLLFRPLGTFQLKGKQDAISVAEILGETKSAHMDQIVFCERFAEALQAFNEHDWVLASQRFASITHDYPEDRPSHFYIERCKNNLDKISGNTDPTIIPILIK